MILTALYACFYKGDIFYGVIFSLLVLVFATAVDSSNTLAKKAEHESVMEAKLSSLQYFTQRIFDALQDENRAYYVEPDSGLIVLVVDDGYEKFGYYFRDGQPQEMEINDSTLLSLDTSSNSREFDDKIFINLHRNLRNKTLKLMAEKIEEAIE
jgi:hypothetical protein